MPPKAPARKSPVPNPKLSKADAGGIRGSKLKVPKKGTTAAPSKKTVVKKEVVKKPSIVRRRQSSIDAEILRRGFLQRKGRRLRILDKVRNIFLGWRKTTSKSRLVTRGQQALKVPGPRYRQPIEKLLKCIKKARIEEIPPDFNIHRHPIKPQTWASSPGVRKEVDILHQTLEKHRRPMQPKVGWSYNKRQKRLLLGRRHRELDGGWRYCEPIKQCLPRNIRINSRLPDALFFTFSTMLFLSLGIHAGAMHGIGSFMYVLEDSVEYKLVKEGGRLGTDETFGDKYWKKHAPFETFVVVYLVLISAVAVLILLGYIGVYLTDQTLHFIYVAGGAICFILLFLTAQKGRNMNFCDDMVKNATIILELLVKNYYEEIEAQDTNRQPVTWTNPQTGAVEVVKIRTYKAANLMDRIQKSWQCCGVKEGFEDYLTKGLEIPPTCCSPLWLSNPYCASGGYEKGSPKLLSEEEGSVACVEVLKQFCKNTHNLIGLNTSSVLLVQLILFTISFWGLLMQMRQIRQLKRPPHLRVPAGTISQSLQTTGGDSGVKTGRVQAVAEASRLTQKQTEHMQQMRFEAATKYRKLEPIDEESSSLTTESSDEAPVTTVNFAAMENLQDYVEKEGLPDAEKTVKDRAMEGFAGRFNIFTSRNLHPYVPHIFSTTFQNETDAGLEAINNILDRQFAQHTTDYNWRKLLVKPKKGDVSVAPSQTNVAPKVTPMRKKGG